MKKVIKRFWGIGLIVIILSSLFVSTAPASATIYSWGELNGTPSVGGKVLATTGITGISATADGANIYVTNDATSGTRLLKSTNGGTGWSTPSADRFTGTTMDLIAVAPDDANFLVVVDKSGAIDNVWLSTNGGNSFSGLTSLGNAMVVNDIAVSPLSGSSRYIVAVGNNSTVGKVSSWKYGDAAPTWAELITDTGYSSKPSGVADVDAVAFSPSFASDQALLVVTTNATGTNFNAVSYNVKAWDGGFDSSFPRVMESTGSNCRAASISLDPTFYFGDTASQIGFVGASILSGGAEFGGVYRISNPNAGRLVQILGSDTDGRSIASVAWDGTNLAAAPYIPAQPAPAAAITIQRSADALSSNTPTFQGSSSLKAPGTGYAPKLIWNGGNLLCVSLGKNAGVARSADLGKSFNGIALLKTTWATITDFNVSADGSVIYLVADDGTDINVWRKTSAWERVMVSANATGQTWLVRTAMADPTAVFLAKYQAKNMYISTDSGETKWTARSCSQDIQDFAAETKDIVYVVKYNATDIVKSTNGAFTWGNPTNTMIADKGSGTVYSLTLIKAGNLVVGGTNGTVAYSADSAATWTGLHALSSSAGAPSVSSLNVVATASGLATGDVVYAASSTAADAVYKWIIGTNAPPDKWSIGQTLGGQASGMVMSGGALYVENYLATANATKRWLSPNAGPGISGGPDSITTGHSASFLNAATGGKPVNSLQASTSGAATTLWASSTSKLYSWTEYLTVAANAPTTVFPTAGYMVPVNSINGNTGGFTFQWNKPSDQNGAIPGTQQYSYELGVYLDSAGKISIGKDTSLTGKDSGLLSVVATSLSPTSATYNAGTTYYWRVKTTAPVTSQWSPMVSLTVQSIAASVPDISSPVNGSAITNQNPAFSWGPVTGTTEYQFQLASLPTFGTGSILIDDKVGSAGFALPATMKLEQGKQYYWRVRANAPVQGEWSAVANFAIAAAPAPAPVTSVVITQVPAPIITIPAAPQVPAITLAPQPIEQVAPPYIWAIIIIGGVLVIAVIVLIVRTRRSV